MISSEKEPRLTAGLWQRPGRCRRRFCRPTGPGLDAGGMQSHSANRLHFAVTPAIRSCRLVILIPTLHLAVRPPDPHSPKTKRQSFQKKKINKLKFPLPITTLRRLETVLAGTTSSVLYQTQPPQVTAGMEKQAGDLFPPNKGIKLFHSPCALTE